MSPVKSPQGPEEGRHRVLRGGGWFSSSESYRAADRDRLPSWYRNYDLGFRVALSLPRRKKP